MLDGLYTDGMDIPGLTAVADELTAYLSSRRMRAKSSLRKPSLRSARRSGGKEEKAQTGASAAQNGHVGESDTLKGHRGGTAPGGREPRAACAGEREDQKRTGERRGCRSENKKEAFADSQQKRAQSYIWWLLGVIKRGGRVFAPGACSALSLLLLLTGP